MANLIDKDALVAEIKSLEDKGKYHEEYDCAYRDGNNGALYALKGKLNTLEMKEVDLDEETDNYWETLTSDVKDSIYFNDFYKIAKHFFELGLRSTITEEDCKLIWNIGDDLPYMSEEEFFKELLKRYKAQKGKLINY